MEVNLPEEKIPNNFLNKISTKITQNPVLAIALAGSLILIGILLDYGLVDYTFTKHSLYNIFIKVISRLLISLGEATFVFLLLQITVEGKMAEKHISIAKGTLDNFQGELLKTLTAIKQESLSVYLEKLFPQQFTDRLINDGFFGFDVIRTETEWFYKIRKNSTGDIELIQEISYSVLNVQKHPIEYVVKLETFNTYESKTKISKVVIGSESKQRLVIEGEELQNLLSNNGKISDGERFEKKIQLAPQESIKIEKIVENCYTDKKITDFHYPTEHTLNLKIKVQFLSPMPEIDFNLYVPFLKEAENKTTEPKPFGYNLSGLDTRVYTVIPLALKGQSVMYEINKRG